MGNRDTSGISMVSGGPLFSIGGSRFLKVFSNHSGFLDLFSPHETASSASSYGFNSGVSYYQDDQALQVEFKEKALAHEAGRSISTTPPFAHRVRARLGRHKLYTKDYKKEAEEMAMAVQESAPVADIEPLSVISEKWRL